MSKSLRDLSALKNDMMTLIKQVQFLSEELQKTQRVLTVVIEKNHPELLEPQ